VSRDEAPPRRSASRALAIAAALAVVVVGVALVFHAGHGVVVRSWPGAAAVVAAMIALGVALDRTRARAGEREVGAVLVIALALLPAMSFGSFVAWLVTGVEGSAPVLAAVLTVAVLAATVFVLGWGGARAPRMVTAAYVVYAVVALGINLVAPTFTLRDASRILGTVAPPGAVVVGAMAHPLSFENRTHPVWFTPRRPRNDVLNADMTRFDVRLVLTVTPPMLFFFPDPGDFPFPLVSAGRFGLYPAPHIVGAPPPKIPLTLYRRAD
jgi:hypothetical protein